MIVPAVGVLTASGLLSLFANKDSKGVGEIALEDLFTWLDLTQSQVATLLGVSPQAISKALKDEDETSFMLKDRRLYRLYGALLHIGGDRYALSADRLKEYASQRFGIALDDSVTNVVSAHDLYLGNDEIWVISDSPARVLDWAAMKAMLYGPEGTDRGKVVVFFLSSLEGAESWSELLEREAAETAVRDGKVQIDEGQKYSSYVFVVVSNLSRFTGDLVITNPGSRCMGMMASAKTMGAYSWTGSAYIPVSSEGLKSFVQAVHRNELGTGSVKAHFFPAGDKLPRELIDFPPKFMDGLIGLLGQEPVGGVLREEARQKESTVSFNARRKYNPAFFLAYKRKPGDSFNSQRVARILQEEIDRQNQSEQKKNLSTDW